ncbi:MAG: hypothetical protein Q9N67_08705 [Ghiorsea sp.]|nr:hypothetical protein [Ghiorsea sp.]
MTNTLAISWCPHGLGIQYDDKHVTFIPAETDENTILPTVPDQTESVSCVYIPLEETLTRYIQLPLKSTKYLDADMLLQELSDRAGIEPDDWWLTWRMKATEDGIAGLVFAIKKDLQAEIQNTSGWQQSPLLLIDGWQRLNAWLDDAQTTAAVVDSDHEGIFFGFYQDGVWRGMRRLNGNHESDAQQMLWSLQSMGFDAVNMPMLGHCSEDIAKHFPQVPQSAAIKDDLPKRHLANFSLKTPVPHDKDTLNIRHGKWATKQTSAAFQIWYRPALLAAAIGALWLGDMMVNNMQQATRLASMQNDITAAFHRGLPDQPVIIDALAQLRQAAGGGTNTHNQAVSQQLNAVSQTFMAIPWEMQSFDIGKRGTSLAGKVKDLDTLNNIRTDLAKRLARDVKIADTDLKGNEVAFRMRW